MIIKIKDNLTNIDALFYECKKLIKVDLSNFDTSRITSFRKLFSYCVNLEEIKGLNNLITSNIEDVGYIFEHCEKIKFLDLSGFDTSNINSFNYMFSWCISLKEIKGLNQFKTHNAIYMDEMFYLCSSLPVIDISSFDGKKATVGGMFAGCKNLKEIKGLQYFSPRYGLDFLFDGCERLTSLDLSSFNMTTIYGMHSTFQNCKNLKEIKGLNNLKTDKLDNLFRAFAGCHSLTSLNLSNFNTARVWTMGYLFEECYNLKEITGLNNFITKNVRSMVGMFQGCSNLISLNLSNFNPKNIEEMSQMFEGCSKLSYLDLSNINTLYVTDMKGIFRGCSNLEFLNIKKFKTNLISREEMLEGINITKCKIIV